MVLDADSRFQGSFESICKFPQITLWNLARVNHKVNSVKKYHQFLNITQAIAGQDCGSRDVFIQNTKHISTRVKSPQ